VDRLIVNDEVAEIIEEIADTEGFLSDIISVIGALCLILILCCAIAERFGVDERDAEELWEEWLREYVFV